MMKSQQMVLDFMRAIDLPLPHDNTPTPGVYKLSATDFKRLRKLVEEEATEFNDAMWELQKALESKDPMWATWWVEVVDAMCDLIVVIHNTSNSMNLDLEPFYEEVMRTNMEKADGPLREDGKRLKPPGWEPPQLSMILEKMLTEGAK